jgi:hypothetical protein
MSQQQTKEALAQERGLRSLVIHFTMDTTVIKALKSVSSLNFVAFFRSIASNGKKMKQEQMCLKTLNFPIQYKCTCHP